MQCCQLLMELDGYRTEKNKADYAKGMDLIRDKSVPFAQSAL